MARQRPNVILVMTDDQGYGDLGCTGNPWIKTPNIDSFHDECVRLPDFHVSPLCTPTRGGIMCGRRPVRNGAWATTWGRSMLGRDETTMADVFSASGYRTGMFGKWHLGDNYPYRPQDRGFEHVVAHKGGGVGQTPDFWGNSYFDDTYFHNGEPVKHTGYCTDVWFDQAVRWIDSCKDEPFFAYVATNAPHAPYLVESRYADPYRDNPNILQPAFYGMITNIDENFGRLDAYLKENGLYDDTILVFMTDNGTSGGWFDEATGYNAGMRGKKGSYYEGGHRVPFFIRWPGGGLTGGRDLADLSLHIDLLPTFIDICGLDGPDADAFDGRSFAPLLRGETEALPDRTHFLQYRQSTIPPEKWTNAVVTNRWRLVAGRELYDIRADPSQQTDVAADNPDTVSVLREAHEAWWAEIEAGLHEYGPISLGNPEENPVRLDAFDLMGDVAWNQNHIREAAEISGGWRVDVEAAGEYEIRLRRWPEEADLPLEGAPDDERGGVSIDAREARVRIGDAEASVPVDDSEKEAVLHLSLEKGVVDCEAEFRDGAGERRGAYYAYVRKM